MGESGEGTWDLSRWLLGSLMRWSCLEGPGLGDGPWLGPWALETHLDCWVLGDAGTASQGLGMVFRCPGRQETHKAFKQERAISLCALLSSVFSWVTLFMSLYC